MDESSSSGSFYMDEPMLGGGEGGMFKLILGLIVLALIAIIVLVVLSFTGKLSRSYAGMITPASQIAWLQQNYTCTRDATTNAWSCKAVDPAVDTDKVPGQENLSTLWKRSHMTSGGPMWSGSAYERCVGRGQC